MRILKTWKIKCNSKDSKRDRAAVELFNRLIRSKEKAILTLKMLLGNPSANIAELSEMLDFTIGTEYIEHNFKNSFHCPFGGSAYRGMLIRTVMSVNPEFSIFIKQKKGKVFTSNMFNFIDTEGYQKYEDDRPIHKLVEEFRQRFGFEHMSWMGGVDPYTGEKRTAVWLAQQAASTLGFKV